MVNQQKPVKRVEREPGTYLVKDIFYTIQGEGFWAGRPAVFVRFGMCNLACPWCDTEYTENLRTMDATGIVRAVLDLWPSPQGTVFVVLTGGEPALQIDGELLRAFRAADAVYREAFFLAVETNGLVPVASGVDWITVSPKTSEESLADQDIDELKYVVGAGDPMPRPRLHARHLWLSPRWDPRANWHAGHDAEWPEGTDPVLVPEANMEHCVAMVKKNPRWRLSIQQHKVWRVE